MDIASEESEGSRVILENMRRTREFKKFAGVVRAANKMADIADEAKEIQTGFLDSIGMTWDQARALPIEEQRKLQQQYTVYLRERDAAAPAKP